MSDHYCIECGEPCDCDQNCDQEEKGCIGCVDCWEADNDDDAEEGSEE